MILLIPVLLIILIPILIYNSLIKRKNAVENAFAGMDVQLKKRYDLIPNLVTTVKEYAAHENETLTELTALRSRVISKDVDSNEKVKIDNQISSKMGQLMVNVENYPDLKANENFIQLQRTLNEVESQISAARRAFNAAVTAFNNAIEIFPNSIIANMMNLARKEVFEISELERQNVNVGDLFKK